MKYKELKALSKEDLQKKVAEAQQELMKDYAQMSAGTSPKSPGHLRQRKRIIAKAKSIMGGEQA